MRQPIHSGSITAARRRRLGSVAIAICCFLCGQSKSLVVAQKAGRDKAWQELVSTEGRFRVLMPDTPEDRFVPVIGQIVNTEMHAYFVRTAVASYVVAYADFPNLKDPHLLKKAYDNGRDRLLASGKFHLVRERDVTAGSISGREIVYDDGANVGTDRIYFVNGRAYQVIFLRPQLGGMADDMVKFYDSLSSKFFDSFKTEDASARR